jgi:hypothetical protein
VSALFQQYINTKMNAYFVQDLANQASNFTQVRHVLLSLTFVAMQTQIPYFNGVQAPSFALKTAVEASAVG